MTTFDRRVSAGFAAAFRGDPERVVRPPGRVNLIGEHTDDDDGFLLPCAIGVETRIASRARADGKLRVVACEVDHETDCFALTLPVAHHPGGGWRDYGRGWRRCCWRMAMRSGASVAGAALPIDSRNLTTWPVPIPPGTAIAIVRSYVSCGLVESHYNRRAECEAAAAALGVARLRDVDPAILAAAADAMPAPVHTRARILS